MLLAAASSSFLTRIHSVPSAVWIRVGLAIAILIGAVVVLRNVAKMNKVVLGVIVFLVLTFIGFNWIYERNEPAWATPVVEKLAGFFPTKNSMK